MKVKTKKGIVDTVKAVDEFSKAAKRLGNTASGTAKSLNGWIDANYILWKLDFKPQSQAVINIVLITGLVLSLAEIVWFVATKL